ncbi:MAG: histidine kinase [Betaproteobacteria bacterium HGW-Betaproteobacteria-7]|jgi:hemerythrin-like metal-binding protein|nr:MAG: histidine kinase [Betaproteobacteria bacterium HGW-Betaproteobacteria-7]
MHAFLWDQRFETGIDTVDRQHQHLVDVVNQLGQLLESGVDLAGDNLQQMFHDLAQYAHRHFADEEKLMSETAIDERHQQAHARHHRQFVEQVVGLWNSRGTLAHPAETLHGFLASWLTVHILGEDQTMARQIAAVTVGTPAADAFADTEHAADTATSILLGAMQRLYGVVSEQNQNLAAINQSLETRIAERTAELQQTNIQLAQEQRELTQLLARIEETQNQLMQSEKMAAIGQLAAGVAHEINNPVGFVNSNIGTLKTYTNQLLAVIAAYEDGAPAAIADARNKADLEFLREDLPTLIHESQDGLSRVTRIVQDLKDFSHVDEAEQQQADLNAGIESTLNVVANEIKYKAEVLRELGDIPAVRCVPAQINQVFMNLLVNAAQAIETRGSITIRSGTENGFVWFEVEDTGKGMTEEVQRRIFEPFYTTKPVGKGTGLGLSLSYDIIVKKHGGRFDVRSTPGVGTCFRLWLPIGSE